MATKRKTKGPGKAKAKGQRAAADLSAHSISATISSRLPPMPAPGDLNVPTPPTAEVSRAHTRAHGVGGGGEPPQEPPQAVGEPEEPNKGGRPSKFTPEVANAIFEFAKLGYTDKEMADALKIGEATLNRWKVERPDYFSQLGKAKDVADVHVVRSLFERATGESRVPAVKITQYEGVPVIVPYIERALPDVEAAKFWLKNRRPGEWRDKIEMDLTGDVAQRLVKARERVQARRQAGSGSRKRAA